MESTIQRGFWLAGESLTNQRQMDIAISFRKQAAHRIIAFVDDGLGDLDDEKEDDPREVADTDNEWERLADKYEELENPVGMNI